MSYNNDTKNIELDNLNLYTELIELNKNVLKSNAEINNKIDKLQSLLNEQENKIQKKDEKLVSLIISQMYSRKDIETANNDIINGLIKKFKTIIPSKSE